MLIRIRTGNRKGAIFESYSKIEHFKFTRKSNWLQYFKHRILFEQIARLFNYSNKQEMGYIRSSMIRNNWERINSSFMLSEKFNSEFIHSFENSRHRLYSLIHSKKKFQNHNYGKQHSQYQSDERQVIIREWMAPSLRTIWLFALLHSKMTSRSFIFA